MKSRLPQIQHKLPAAVNAALKDGADRIVEGAKLRAPVRTGALKESIESRPGVFEIRGRPAQGYGIYAAWYYHFVEWGTEAHGEGGGNAPAQPFMVPAAEAERPRLLADIKKALGDL
jgi:HK97 gp10 family phage protein